MERELLRASARAFPARTDLAISSLTRIADGWECDVYAFGLKGEEAGEARREELILRLFPGADGREKAAKEFAVLERLHGTGFPVPRVFLLDEQAALLGAPCIIMERIAGNLLGSQLRQSNGEQRQAWLERFCRMFVELHTLDWRPLVPDPSHYQADGFLERWLLWARGFSQQFRLNDFDPVLTWLEDRRGAVPVQALSLTHGDYHPRNVLVRPDGAAFVIDWTSAEVSDYRFDLGWTLLLLRTSFDSALSDAVRAEYERLAGTPVQGMAFFEVAACARRLFAIVVSIRDGAAALGMRPGAEALMRGNVRHVQTAYALLRERTGLTLPMVESLIASLA